MSVIDLRSDTVTRPTAAMRQAMATADVGDDCYGEDPTVNRLQDLAAAKLGTKAALFVPSGTMANQIAVKVVSAPGGEVICEDDCHLIHHESGACALLSQVQLRALAGNGGVLDPESVKLAVRGSDPFQPRTVSVAIENTHNAAGGTVWPLPAVEAVSRVAHEANLPLICDGARLFNACVASGVAPEAYAAHCDLVTISLYKGLAAPMGSLVCGSADLISRAWRYRRVFGGALRQGGIVAAAGIVALETMVDRLAVDHENARNLAEGFASIAPPGAVPIPQTNMVVFDSSSIGVSGGRVLSSLRSQGVLAGLISPGVVRFVTHHDIDRNDIPRAVDAFASMRKDVG